MDVNKIFPDCLNSEQTTNGCDESCINVRKKQIIIIIIIIITTTIIIIIIIIQLILFILFSGMDFKF